jgi:copper(I)-binding protein
VLPAKGQQLFEPGGYHVMVFGVKNVQVGGQIPVVLYWQDGSQQEVLLDVRQR